MAQCSSELWREPTRWGIMSGLMLEAFGAVGTTLAAIGLMWLVIRKWRIALLTLSTFCGYFLYGLIYNVADVSVFILPAHILMAMWIGIAVAQGTRWLSSRFSHSEPRSGEREASHIQDVAPSDNLRTSTLALIWTAFALLPLNLLWTNGPLLDQSNAGWKLYDWGKYVMSLPLPTGSAILADSEKIAPLYYLKRIENVRPDVDTLVLGDEGLYRSRA